MKWLRICLLILVIFAISLLSACSPGGVASRRSNCSQGGEVCVNLSTVKSFAMGDPVPLKITVTSSKDFADLNLTLHIGGGITVDGPQTWEKNISNPTIDRGVAYWNFSIKAGQSLTFTRVLHFPQSEGYFNIDVSVVNTGRIIDAEDYFNVLLTKENGGQVILEGTPLPPHTPNDTSGVYGPGTPTPTLVTNPTYAHPTSTPVTPFIATSTSPPYPLPSSSPPLQNSVPYP